MLLYRAGFEAPPNYRIQFQVNAQVRDLIEAQAGRQFSNPSQGIDLAEAVSWFEAARLANAAHPLPSSTPGQSWVDDSLQILLDMIAQRSGNTFISGYQLLADVAKFHSPRRSTEVSREIYQHLVAGKIVILDLSVGDPLLREKISTQVAQRVFDINMQDFTEGKNPPNIVVYIEEAHNLIGKNLDLTHTWPRLAKEGAKYRIALVYATQEVSSVHPNILSNTENWFITHLNNEREVKELGQFYDFADFGRSLLRAQDVGFTRVKTLSSPFVIPVQVDQFNPEAEKAKVAALKTKQGG